jgi:hypothetical protein
MAVPAVVTVRTTKAVCRIALREYRIKDLKSFFVLLMLQIYKSFGIYAQKTLKKIAKFG